MKSEPAGSAEEPTADQRIVFVSDASAEAERLTLSLRARGYAAVDVPAALLVGRIAVQRPDLVLCDADADDVAELISAIQNLGGEDPIPIVLLGDGDRAQMALTPTTPRAVFERPVDPAELVHAVEQLAGLPSEDAAGRGLVVSSRPPPRAAQGVPSSRSERPRIDGPPAGASIPLPPDLSGEGAPARGGTEVPTVELGEDIQRLLADAEERFGDRSAEPRGEDPGPGIDIDGLVPPEVLAALDEPLDEEDVADEGTADPIADGTGALTAARGAKVGLTQMGGTATGATSLGTESQGPPSTDSGVLAPEAMGPGTALEERGPEARPTEPPGFENTESRKARQQASTPKPPKPSPEDLLGPSEPPDERASVAPATAAIPSPGVESRGEPARAHSTRPPPFDPLPESAPRDESVRGTVASTTPPHRRRNESADDVPDELPPSRAPHEPIGEGLGLPDKLVPGSSVSVLAKVIRTRFTGTLAFEVDEGIRRVVFRDGDFVTAASGVHAESLVAFLTARGELPPEVARQAHKLPAYGRRAGAALIAYGHLAQDHLWPVLRAHAEWLIGRVVRIDTGNVTVEDDAGRLHDEPAVFGGATGAEVLVEVVRREISPDEAVKRLGGGASVLGVGPARSLLAECALAATDAERVQAADRSTLDAVLDDAGDPSLAPVLYALVALGICKVEGPRAQAPRRAAPEHDAIDDDALRARVLARKALVDEGDYFALLGVARDATGYDIRRAYAALRREFEPSAALTGRTADLADTLDEIVHVLEEAYEILSDQRRRDRYRRAIEATP